ncbi:MAG: beta-lactamase domain protein [Conexibacter sp.]|nr:beta-lactamase domain protein [Conexibacter sp.]
MQALARAAQAGIHCLPVPTPFAVGRINCYLIEDDPLTLVDCGPNSGTALDELERLLAAHGRAVEEIELIVITHQHLDHIGLVDVVARRSGAEIAALDRVTRYLGDYDREAGLDDDYAVGIMHRHGIPPDVATALRSVSAAFRGFGGAAAVTRPLADGSRLELRDRSFEVLHRPGHSPSDTLFWDERRQILLAGDHLIKHISSNPLITRPLPPDPADDRPHALRSYVASLQATHELPAELVLAGHGEPISDHRSLIEERLAATERRKRKVLGLLAERPLTAYELAQRMWGNVAVTQAFLTLSEVVGHLDLLREEGAVRELEAGGVVRFEALVAAPSPDDGPARPPSSGR